MPVNIGTTSTPATPQEELDRLKKDTTYAGGQFFGRTPTGIVNLQTNTMALTNEEVASLGRQERLPRSPLPSFPEPADTAAARTTLASPTAGLSEASLVEERRKESQAYQDAINKAFDAQISQEKELGVQREAEANAQNILSGLVGSPSAFTSIDKTRTETSKQIENINAQRAREIAQVLQSVTSQAHTDFQRQVEGARLSAQDVLAFQKENEQKAIDHSTKLAGAGINLDAFKVTYPDEYNYLLNTAYGGDEQAMQADFILKKPQDQVVAHDVSGSTFYQVTKNPLTGAIKTEHFDLGFKIPTDYTASVDRTNGVLILSPKKYDPDKTIEEQIIVKKYGAGTAGGRAEQLKIESREVSIARGKQAIEASKAMEAVRIIGPSLKTDAVIKRYSEAMGTQGRIEAALREAESGNINSQNIKSLMDGMTQLETGGNQITEAQVGLSKDYISYVSRIKVFLNKFDPEKGGPISITEVRQLGKLYRDIFAWYKTAYKEHLKQYDARLSNVHGQDLRAYNPIVDMSNLPSVLSGGYERNLQKEININAPEIDTTVGDAGETGSDIIVQLEAEGATDNGDGTWTMPDGTPVLPQ